MDEELQQLDLAIAEARLVATENLHALRAPQAALRAAAARYIESVASHHIDAARHASPAVMAQLSDDDIIELRFWAEEQVLVVGSRVERGIDSCDFWIPDTSGLSATDVSTYAVALAPRSQDSRSGIPQRLVLLFEECLEPLRDGLAVVGLTNADARPEPHLEATLVRAWRTYRENAVDCLINWADVDERYQISAARFQEMRWETAGEADFAALKAQRADEIARAGQDAEAAFAEAEVLASAPAAEATRDEPLADAPELPTTSPLLRPNSERLIPVSS